MNESPLPGVLGQCLSALDCVTLASQTQLSTSEICLERCRLAVEWQFAVYEQARLLTDSIQLNIAALSSQIRTLRSASTPPAGWRQTVQGVMGEVDMADQTLLSMQELSEQLRQELCQLVDSVSRVEHLTSSLSQTNEQASGLRERLAIIRNVHMT